ncbi:MAG: hypothetical protein KBS63_06795 [Clostridiales bacterium]|nr:hypothetical protein [Candidatus Crickella caballi]
MKKTFYTELAYLVGLTTLALGVALTEYADFGLSMVVAPAYLIHLKISQYFSWFTFGMAEYCLQALLIIILSITMMRCKIKYLFSFVTAFIYGNILDVIMKIIGLVPESIMSLRIIFYILGITVSALGVSFIFHTYITPEAYELVVKEIAEKTNKNIHVVKTIYDCSSCLIAITMSFVFFGFGVFEGIKFGTFFCALINGWLIGRCSKLLEKKFEFKDALSIKEKFE